ncbi:hypothetical protein LJC20_05170 [Eubacteriales bacterium OttesenSCG-928-M02]|nr:hypothetical protein [Eubacteriales bacterium OttesenSCG-928-M02]
MKKLMALGAIFLSLLSPMTAWAQGEQDGDTLIKEYTFETDSRDAAYEDAPEEITEDGRVFYRGEITYEVVDEREETKTEQALYERTSEKEGLSYKDDSRFPTEFEVDEDGFAGIIPLSEIVYNPRKVTGRSVYHTAEYDYGYQTTIPEPLPKLDALYFDKATRCEVLAPLTYLGIRMVEDWHWEDNFLSEHLYRSIDADTYYLRDRTALSFDTEKPEYVGIEDRLLSQMRLDPDHYQIIGSRWVDEKTQDGNVYARQAQYIMKRYVSRHVATYGDTIQIPNILVYDAVAYYKGTLEKEIVVGHIYTIKATVSYRGEPPVDHTWKWAAGGGIVAICGLVFFLIRRKRRKTEIQAAQI